jgi:hypothetical protein
MLSENLTFAMTRISPEFQLINLPYVDAVGKLYISNEPGFLLNFLHGLDPLRTLAPLARAAAFVSCGRGSRGPSRPKG